MRKKKKKEITSIDEIEVKLKPIGNIRPGVYLTVLYAAAVVIILFLVFLLPGVRNPGEELHFTVLPESAAVYIDGAYAGTAPCKQFVSAGDRQITIGKNGYISYSKTITVGSRLFGSLLFPKKHPVSVRLEAETPVSPLTAAFTDFADWSGISSFHYRYQPEPVISTAIAGIYYGNMDIDDAAISSFFTAAAPLVNNEALLKDFLRGFVLSRTKGRALSPSSFLDTIAAAAAAQDRMGNLPFWAASALSGDRLEAVRTGTWYNSARAELIEALESSAEHPADTPVDDMQVVTVAGIDFIFIPQGTFILGAAGQDSFPVVYTSRPFYIGSSEISYRQFSKFIEERPQFHPSKREELIRDGLVTEDYLKDWDENRDSDLPAAFVSYFVAAEYCRWIETKLPGFVAADFTVRLPDEYEWETAANFSSADGAVLHSDASAGPKPVTRNGKRHLVDFYGNLWEWCDNWYASSDFVLFGEDGGRILPDPVFSGVEKSVRGGSYAVMEDLVSISSRGSQPPDWCTPFLGFRPAIVPKN